MIEKIRYKMLEELKDFAVYASRLLKHKEYDVRRRKEMLHDVFLETYGGVNVVGSLDEELRDTKNYVVDGLRKVLNLTIDSLNEQELEMIK